MRSTHPASISFGSRTPSRARHGALAIVCAVLLSAGECERTTPLAPNLPDPDLAGIELQCDWNTLGGLSGTLPIYCSATYAVYRSTTEKKFVSAGAVQYQSLNPQVATLDVAATGAWVRRVTDGAVEICGTFQGVSGGYRITITPTGCVGTVPGGHCPGMMTLPCGTDHHAWP